VKQQLELVTKGEHQTKVDLKTDKPGGLFGLGTGGTLALGAATVPLLGTLGGGR
jgi:hypothetical protein